jgi:hypothetical protein
LSDVYRPTPAVQAALVLRQLPEVEQSPSMVAQGQ